MKQILITGANAGLGFASSKLLAQEGHHIIMLCRDRQRGEKALQEVLAYGSAELILCDISDMNNILRLKTLFVDRDIDVLMHNAGVIHTSRTLNPQGFEGTIATNHLGVYLLTHTLWNNLTKGGRIVVVSSDAHKAAKLDLNTWMAEKKYSMIQQYGVSKMCNILFTIELAKRAKKYNITVNALHPGGVNTKLGDNNTVWYAGFFRWMKKLMLSPEKGADTQVWLATAPEMENITGGYYYKRKIRSRNAQAKDPKLATVLWNHSAKLLNISPDWP